MSDAKTAKRVERVIAILPNIMNSIALSRVHSSDPQKIDLTFNQYQALLHIHRFGECSVNDLSAVMNIAQSTTSQLVDRLVNAKLVSRETHSEDRRKMVVMLSKKGREMMERRTESMRETYIRVFSMLDDADQDKFEQAFIHFHEIAQKIELKMKSHGE
jgi:DNA-binding MarR family transcriptional regulator